MRDKRPVDELSIEELERILAIRKREARQQQLRRMNQVGRRATPDPTLIDPLMGRPVAIAPQSVPAETDGSVPMEPDQPNPEVAASPETGTPRFEEDYWPTPKTPTASQSPNPFLKMVWNRTLLLIEIAAVIGLVVIVANLFQALQTLQAETAAVQAEAQSLALASLPTPSVTPEIDLNRIVLPGGHTPPTAGQSSQFNLSEIPEHLRPLVQQQMAAPIAIPTPGPESPVRIRIPAIGVDSSVVSGTDWEALRRGVGHHNGTGQPGQPGNMVLSAHNDIYGEIFRYLDQLQPEDEIIINTFTQTYTYVVREWQIVRPSDVWVMDATHNPTATLISCYPYQVDNQRIVVFADLSVS